MVTIRLDMDLLENSKFIEHLKMIQHAVSLGQD